MVTPSSPRLPSPPPPVENRIGPMSPSGGAAPSPEPSPMEQGLIDANSRRRIHPGTKAADMAAGPPLVPLHELETAFQLQEHLAALHWHHTAAGTKPITRETALEIAKPPAGVDRSIWLYELCRFLISQCNSLIVGFLFDSPPCSAFTCPEMRASEWQFLCAVHEQPKSCCAIDYCCHTLDWAANVVTDQKIFPSRFSVLSDLKSAGLKSLVNVFRRLHRMFAHAWFQHRSVFWAVEQQSGLYLFFKGVCDLFEVLPPENYRLPPEAEGLEAASEEPETPVSMTILKSGSSQRLPTEDDPPPPSRTNTRRHVRSSPSTGSAVTTVMEADEEDSSGVSKKMRDLQITAPETVEEEEDAESAEVPVMVESSVVSHHEPAQEPELSDVETDTDETVIEFGISIEEDEEDDDVQKSQPAPAEPTPETSTPATVETQAATETDAPAEEQAPEPEKGSAALPGDTEEGVKNEEGEKAETEAVSTEGGDKNTDQENDEGSAPKQ